MSIPIDSVNGHSMISTTNKALASSAAGFSLNVPVTTWVFVVDENPDQQPVYIVQ